MFRNALLAASILVGGAATAGAANLVTNGSFETGSFAGWTLTNPATDTPAVVIPYNSNATYPGGAFGEAIPPANAPSNSPDAAGDFAGYFVGDFASNETLSQSIFLTVGTYQIGFSAYLPANGLANAGEATFVGNILSFNLANFVASSQAGLVWQSYQGATDIAADGFYTVEFIFNTDFNPAKDVVIDQVYVIAGNPPPPVPEPASLALLGAGLLGLGFARRARKAA